MRIPWIFAGLEIYSVLLASPAEAEKIISLPREMPLQNVPGTAAKVTQEAQELKLHALFPHPCHGW